MSTFDRQWAEVVKDILMKGEQQEGKEITSKYISDNQPAPTTYKYGYQMRFTREEFPMLFSKKHLVKLAWEEIKCILIKKTNKVQEFRDVGIKFWDQWEYKEGPWKGTIGPAYGYQVATELSLYPEERLKRELLDNGTKDNPKYPMALSHDGNVYLDQLDMLIQKLANSKEYGIGRSNIITLLIPSDVDDMAIFPCVWNSSYYVSKGKLTTIVTIRSNDMALGNVFNVSQYYMFMLALCHTTGLEFGELVFNIGDAHVYSRHIPQVTDMIARIESGMYDECKATIYIKPDAPKNIYELDFTDFVIEGYVPGEQLSFDLAYTKSPNVTTN